MVGDAPEHFLMVSAVYRHRSDAHSGGEHLPAIFGIQPAEDLAAKMSRELASLAESARFGMVGLPPNFQAIGLFRYEWHVNRPG